MKKTLIILSLAALAITGCQQFKKGEGGMLYKIHTDKDGPTIKDGDFISINVVQKTDDDSVMYSSYEYDRPAFLNVQKPGYKGDIFSALGLLSEGDSATFKMDIDTLEAAMKKQGNPSQTRPKGKYIVYTFTVKKVIPKGTKTDSVFNATIQEFLKKEIDIAKNSETAKINKFIASKSYTPQTTASGLRYVVTHQGAGPAAAKGDTVEVNYTVSLLTGKIFDSSIPEVAKGAVTYNPQRPYAPIKTPAGLGQSIPGFDEALLMFPKGSKVTLILSSKLAYGEQGNQQIPPYTPLVFDVDVLRIIPAKPGSALPSAPPTAPAATPKK